MSTLTAAQLDFFCTHVLLIPNAKEMKSRDPVGLLNLLAERMHKKNPFNNIWDSITNMLLGDKRFKVAPFQLYRAPQQLRLFMGQGGTCVHLSSILLLLLKHLGFFKSYMGMGLTKNKPGMEMLHFIVFIPNVLHENDLWMIDPGTRLAPLFQAVPLHKVKALGSVDMGRSSFVQSKVTYSNESNSFSRHFRHLGSNDEYGLFYDFDEEEYSISNPNDPHILDLTLIGTKKRIVEYIQCRQRSDQDVGAFWERNLLLTGFNNDKGAVFVNNKFKWEDDSGILQEIVLKSKEELLSKLFENFPQLNCPEIEFFVDKIWTAKYGANL